jgi:hypothetical protein
MSVVRPLAISSAKRSGLRRRIAPDRLQVVEAHQLGLRVMAHAARIVEVDVLELRALRHDLEELVGLLLVLHERVLDVRVVEDVDHLLRDGVLVDRHRDATEGLGRGHGPVQARAVLADDMTHPALEPLRGEPAGERAHLALDLAPGPGLPDAEVFLANRRPVRTDLRVMQEQARKRVQLPGHVALLGSMRLCESSAAA